MSRHAAGSLGFMLVELLTAMMFVSILSLMTHGWARAVLQDSRRQSAAAEAQELAAIAAEMMAREIRGVGFGVAELEHGLAVAAGGSIELRSDLDGDGTTDGPHERIVYSYRAASARLVRSSGDGNAQLVADGIARDGFRLRYFDTAGTQLASGGEALTEAERRSVRRVDLSISVERGGPGQTVRGMAATSACLRNHGR